MLKIVKYIAVITVTSAFIAGAGQGDINDD
ncbi:MAG: hypothetical protein ACJAUL_003947 [Paraglaciecola sp.]|jgi:hypothetical protein